jgi:hypothetical protein
VGAGNTFCTTSFSGSGSETSDFGREMGAQEISLTAVTSKGIEHALMSDKTGGVFGENKMFCKKTTEMIPACRNKEIKNAHILTFSHLRLIVPPPNEFEKTPRLLINS